MRGARFTELARRGDDASGSWAVACQLGAAAGKFEIGTGAAEEAPERRVFRLDGAAPRTQTEIATRLSAVWLTPQMDRLFTDPASGRRKFLDRLVVALEPAHAREIAAFESASAQRNRLLAEGGDPDWLAGLEDSMARHAVAATAARATLLARLNDALAGGAAAPFPRCGRRWSARLRRGWPKPRRWRWRIGCARCWRSAAPRMRSPAARVLARSGRNY